MKQVLKGAGSQLGGLARHVAGQVTKAPFEILSDATGVKSGDRSENDALSQMESSASGNNQTQGMHQGKVSDYSGFKTADDYQKYVELSGRRDEIEMNMLRKRLHAEYGISTDTEAGMQRARMARRKRDEERGRVEEKQEEQKKLMLEEKNKESLQVKAAKGASGAETRVGKKIAG